MSQEITCPHCKRPIYDEDALLCHFCGESLHRSSSDALGRMKQGYLINWFVILVFIVIIAFLMVKLF